MVPAAMITAVPAGTPGTTSKGTEVRATGQRLGDHSVGGQRPDEALRAVDGAAQAAVVFPPP